MSKPRTLEVNPEADGTYRLHIARAEVEYGPPESEIQHGMLPVHQIVLHLDNGMKLSVTFAEAALEGLRNGICHDRPRI